MKDNDKFYCVKEKTLVEPEESTIERDHRMKNGKLADKAPCPHCGTVMYRLKRG